MKLLIDTQCWLWMNASPEKLSRRTHGLLMDPGTERLLSAVSIWEIGIKYHLGKLPLPVAPADYVPARMALTRTAELAIIGSHALRASSLPALHRDPFDRILVAQALVEGLILVTADERLMKYGVPVLMV